MQDDRIILVRHGRPSLSRKVRLTWRGYRDWWQQYDAGGLAEQQKIPPRVKELATAAEDPDLIDNDLVEAALPPPHLGPLKLGPKSWGTLARVFWFIGWSDGMESHSEARVRANRMAQKLADHSSGGKTVLVTAHGWYNRMVKGSLQKQGWKCISQNGDLHWSHRVFIRAEKDEDGG